jgi:predicted negative regulator of RcsB-dependent stress response
MDNSSERTATKINKARRIVRYTVTVAASILLIFVCIVGYNF